ncbi:MAG TPA: aminotransferase class III-fold pyridoxal phosphate-dependent enzyme [Woeseiaceae bacterium]|nr:aminotransferase class III-fold pyridoxal phosphate-dependent enzyme [Woeseiaceae bacterium]
MPANLQEVQAMEAAATMPVYGQMPFLPERGEGCELVTADGRRILDFYGGHAVAGLGYGHPALTNAIEGQARQLLFQSNAMAMEVRAEAARALTAIAPRPLDRVFFVNSGAEANENALRIACTTTGRERILALTHGFHGRTAAAAAVTWNAARTWYGFPRLPFDVDFIPRNDLAAAEAMIDETVAAVIFEPVQGIGGAFDLSVEFVTTLRRLTRQSGALLIADEVQCGMGRSGSYFAVQGMDVQPDLLTLAKSLGGGVPCGALLATEELGAAQKTGKLGSTFGGGPLACAAISAVLRAIESENLLANAREREAQIRATCIAGPVQMIQGRGLMLGLVCDHPAADVQKALLERDILVGTSSDPAVVRLLPPLVLESLHVERLAEALAALEDTPTLPNTGSSTLQSGTSQ